MRYVKKIDENFNEDELDFFIEYLKKKDGIRLSKILRILNPSEQEYVKKGLGID